MIEHEEGYHQFDYFAAKLQCGQSVPLPNIMTSSPLYVKPIQADEIRAESSPDIALLLILAIVILTIIAITTTVYIFKGKQAINHHL